MLKNVSIIGTVLTKNAFKYISNVQIKNYLPKVSVAAVFQQKDFFFDGVNGEKINQDFFTKKLIEYEVSKTLWDDILESESEIIILDFLDDFFDYLYNSEQNLIVTKSNYLVKNDLHKTLFKNWSLIDKFSDKSLQFWKEGIERLSKNLSDTTIRICLIKAFFPEYIREDGKQKLLSDRALLSVKKRNDLLKIYYEFIEGTLKCDVIDIPVDNLTTCIHTNGVSISNTCQEYEMYVAKEIVNLYGSYTQYIPPLQERVESLFEMFGGLLNHIPSISELYEAGKEFEKVGKLNEAKKCERLVSLLHNSSVPLDVDIGVGVSFGYGGIGTIIHANAKIGNYCVIGSNVTIGGGKSAKVNGKVSFVPTIEDRVYIATGAKLLGGITIGNHSIIGANAVVTKDVEPFSVIAGNPAKTINKITCDNYKNYINYLYKGLSAENAKSMMFGCEVFDNKKPMIGQKKLKVAIIGSCVTRDAFEYIKDTEILYVERTSFVSLISKPFPIMEDEIKIEGNFERRMVLWDLDKQFLIRLAEFKPDLIVLDFIDERFDLIEYNQGFYSRSNYLVNSGILDQMNNYKIIRRQSTEDLWKNACKIVSKKLCSITKNIVLHQTHWARQYRHPDSGKIIEFNAEAMTIAETNNKILDSYYNILKQEIPDLGVISYEPDLLFSDYAHQWGKDYFHFGKEYYQDIAKKIIKFIDTMDKNDDL